MLKQELKAHSHQQTRKDKTTKKNQSISESKKELLAHYRYNHQNFGDKIQKEKVFYCVCRKKYCENDNQLPVSKPVDDKTKQYCETSDLIFDYITDHYKKCDGSKIKLKEIFNHFKASEQFLNLNIKQKSQYMYKNFIAKLDSNVFLRKNIVQNSKEVYELHGYERKSEETDDDTIND